MVNIALPEPLNPLRSPHRKLAPVTSQTISFDSDAQGWKGVDRIEHHAAGGAKGGYITVSRSGGALPIALSPVKSPLAGDWPQVLGGRGARLSCQVRSARSGGKVRVEIFAGDTAQWSHELDATFTPQWTEAAASLRYGWSDAEAAEAGWVRSATGSSWSDTVTHVGKVVVSSGVMEKLERFDLDEVSVAGE